MLIVVALLAFCRAAMAGAVLVPTAPLVADGQTASTVRLYIDGTDTPRVRVKSEAGKVGPMAIGTDRIAAFPFTPAPVPSPRTVPLTVIVGGSEQVIEVMVAPKLAGSLALAVDPGEISSASSATVKVTPSGASPVEPTQRKFVVRATSGTLDSPVPAGDGTYAARYTPAKGLPASQFVVLAVADAADPAVQGYAVVPVTVKRSLTFDAQPGSSNMLTAGGKQYGPFVAAPSGKVAFDIELDPRVRTGRLAGQNPDTSKFAKDVEIPGAAGATQLVILPLPGSIPAEPGLRVPVRVLAIGPDGAPQDQAGLAVTASAGTLAPPDAKSKDWLFAPPATAGKVTLSAELGGARATAEVRILPSLPQVALVAEPVQIPKSSTSFKVVARVKDAQGMGLAGRPPSLAGEGATSSSTKDNKDGSYTASFSTGSTKVTRARVSAVGPVEASSLAPVRIIGWPSSPTVAANGKDSALVTLAALDRYDMPVAGLEMRIGVPVGDGGVPLSAKTDARGVARLAYNAGTAGGVAGVRATAAGLVVDVPIFQVTGAGAAPPPGGSPEHEAALRRWRTVAPTLVIDREGSIPPSGPPTVVQVSTVPTYTTPGAAILVTAWVSDAAGGPAIGQRLDVSASPASVGTITDNRDGSYEVPIQLPAGTDGPITLTVRVGAASGGIVLPTLAEAGSAPRQQTARPAPGGAPGPRAAQAPSAAAGGDRPRLRLAAFLSDSLASYSAEGDGGALLTEAAYTSPGIGFLGVGLDGQYWVLEQDWGALGADLRLGTTAQFIQAGDNKFLDMGRNVLVGARYRRAFGIFSVQGGLGFHHSSVPVFSYEDDARTEATLEELPLSGVRVAAHGTLDLDRVNLDLELAETFVPFPIDTRVGLQAEYYLADTIGLHAGLGYDGRSFEVDAGDGDAEIEDGAFTITLGAAYRMF